jgi:hypothetical protein
MTLTQKDFDGIQAVVKVAVDEAIEENGLVCKEDIKHLPTKDEFYESEDKIVGELAKVREAHVILTGKVYDDLEDRVSECETKLNIHSI